MLLSTTTTRTLPQGRGCCAAASLPRPHQPRLTRTAAASSSSSDVTAISPSNGNGVAPAPPAPTASPPPAAAPPATAPFRPSAAAVSATKLELLSELSALDRGTLATPAQRDTINRLVASLEASGSGSPEPFAGSPAPVEGRWQLIYNSKAVFTASPFFPAFRNGLVQDASLADAIFAFTDAIPGAEIGAASQTVSLLSSSLISEVDMTVFPGFTGTVITSSRLQVLSPTRLGLDVQSTRVANSSFSPFLDGISVPVEQLVEAVRGAGATRVIYDVTFVDDTLRVTRCDDQLLVHRRV